MTRALLVLLLTTLGVGHTLAQTPAGAKGTFSSKDSTFTVAGAVAFSDKSSLDGETPIVRVAISNTALDADAIADFLDRRRAIEHLVKDDETPIVYLEFTPQGRWRGLSYYLAPGNGCGFCTSDVTAAVTIVNGRLTGTVKGTEQDRPFDVALDIPVLSDNHGPALPADGGAPGKAYLAYHAALAKRDAEALEPTLSPGNLGVFARAKKNNDLDGYLSYLVEKHQLTTVRITQGWATARKASLLVVGESSLGKMSGEVLLITSKGVWGVDEELIDLDLGQ